MSWFGRNRHWILLVLLLGTSVALVGTVAVGALGLLASLLAGASAGALLADVAVALVAVSILAVIEIALAAALVVIAVRAVSIPTSPRLAALLSVVERAMPPLRDLGLSARFEPDAGDRRRKLRRRYVEGDLTMAEFERAVGDLLDETDRREQIANARPTSRDRTDLAGARDREVDRE